MKIISTLCILFFLLSVSLKGQEDTFSRSLSIDFLGVIMPNHPLELMYRKANPRITWRTSVSVNAQLGNYSSPVNNAGIQEQQLTDLQIGVSQGIQKEKKIGRFLGYWGIDGVFRYGYFNQDFSLVENSPATNTRTERINQRTGHT
ncbi:MAG: hypothetical protein AAFR59_03270, partial [Bacteroidota bacterium]